MSDDWRNPPPKTKYRMMWMGEWRPVKHMLDSRKTETTMPLRAIAAVLYIGKDDWITIAVDPGDIMENADYRTEDWEIDHVSDPLTKPKDGS